MIDLEHHDPKTLLRAVERARHRNIIIPTLRQQKSPQLIPKKVQSKLTQIGLWDLNPFNLFRISWHNHPKPHGGLYGDVNTLELPSRLTGVRARIVCLIGKWFPTGAHKVGAAFGCLAPRLVTGQFDPTTEKAVWPSTGNYCRGGAYDSHLLGCESIAVLPEGMSRERFQWLEGVAGEVIRTPGTESNVKEIFDKCWELRRSGQDLCIFNQFDEFGNYLWHYEVTGAAMREVVKRVSEKRSRFSGTVLTTGSSGTLAAGDFMKQQFPLSKIAASEALQCPTLLNNGFGSHRIEGIGDKHVPWIHNVRNTDVVIGVDDRDCLNLMRLFNEETGQEYLAGQGVGHSTIEQLPLLGISSIANLIASVKFAKYYELDRDDLVLTLATDSMDLYGSRLQEIADRQGPLSPTHAAVAHQRSLLGAGNGDMLELTYYSRKRIHNLKYYTWVEQQGKDHDELVAQWHDSDYWTRIQGTAPRLDALIDEFNQASGLLDSL